MFTGADLATMRECQNLHMQDQCNIYRYSEIGTDTHGMPITNLVLSSSSICGLDTRASREMLNATARVYDAKLRLPLGTRIQSNDRIEITTRFGEVLEESLTYDVLGGPIQGPSGIIVNLRSIPNG